MVIDGNEKETQAMLAFNAGDKKLARELEQEFLDELKEMKAAGGDHWSCKEPCRHHGDCVSCVAMHRAHRDHLPNCFHDMVNERLLSLSSLTEHSIAGKLK